MNHQKSELYFLLILLSGIFVLAFFIFKPFLYALILAIVFATVFGPVHKRALILREREGAWRRYLPPSPFLSSLLCLSHF